MQDVVALIDRRIRRRSFVCGGMYKRVPVGGTVGVPIALLLRADRHLGVKGAVAVEVATSSVRRFQ